MSWPKQRRLIQDLRNVLQRDFGCQDAWVVTRDGRYRLEVRFGGRVRVLVEDDEEPFWARFYVPLTRERFHLGEPVTEVRQWRKSPAELSALLREYWTQQVEPLHE